MWITELWVKHIPTRFPTNILHIHVAATSRGAVVIVSQTVLVKGNRPEKELGISLQDETMDVSRSTPQGSPYHADVIYLLI